MGRLEIRVCGARNVANVQKVGKPDPYVKVKLGSNKKSQIKYKTHVAENCLNPVWNELFKFQVADYDSMQVVFELWNDNVIVDDLLGSYSLSLNGLTRGVVVDTWVLLEGTKGSPSELHLRVLAVDFGRDPGPGDRLTLSLEGDTMVPSTGQTYRPPKNYVPPAQGIVLQSYPPAPLGPPPPVVYSASAAPMPQVQYGYMAPPQPQGYAYGAPPPPPQQPPSQGYGYGAAPAPQNYSYGAPPPPQPMYGAPQPPQSLPYAAGPPPPQMYGPPPPQRRPVQMAYGIPPDM
ncbi:c2 domain protein [Leishmania donovani]|uniref:C2_domain_protein_-_putative n=3 Tax=Leishmania donovani species complex TaxID=38574 RepID=A0A6L0XWU1_LEIIN|nr:putative c2 domain protein [Leishmania infantum JPCM5]TPP41542.1 C2 domain family protein [Leishmania donovani]CAC9518150.1 c2_domain_protein_-_putative [Leishmania infantum]CAJ1991264.1 c2 domain protein [Leishmania donovani]CAM70398.1 putative c2 domain protein [Leishmania infantum JPCM5]SUZ44286.1 c2_domain_protein_-_putative [Leishmania infantum]|eukprot:XP_001467342.1 putative c2 domain protein [Leishmania infantum JPCM5]